MVDCQEVALAQAEGRSLRSVTEKLKKHKRFFGVKKNVLLSTHERPEH